MSKDPSKPPTLCSARRRNGEPCRKYPLRGTNVCRLHGGAAPQVRRKAEERIREAADPAAAKLVELMSSPDVPYNVQLQAARDLLDRAGISSSQPIQLEIKPWAHNIGGLLADTVEDVIEGEVLEIAPAPAEVAPPRPARVRDKAPPQYGRRPAEARRRGRPPSLGSGASGVGSPPRPGGPTASRGRPVAVRSSRGA